MIRIGSNTKTNIADPCGKENEGTRFDALLVKGKIYALISRFTGSGSETKVVSTSCAGGVRGDFGPFFADEKDKILLASLTLPVYITARSETQEDEQIDEMRPTQEEIDLAVIVFMIDNTPGEPLLVEAIKGKVEVEDSTGDMRILKEGEVFTKDWKPVVDPAEAETVIVKTKVK
jgi:hypothetical protein